MDGLARYGMSPGAAAAYERMVYHDDVRDILSVIQVPTLILHRREDSPEENRYLADHIPGRSTSGCQRANTFPSSVIRTP